MAVTLDEAVVLPGQHRRRRLHRSRRRLAAREHRPVHAPAAAATPCRSARCSSSGSGDTYSQYRAGQAFNLGDLPNGIYYIAVKANPLGNLVESDTANNLSLRKVRHGRHPEQRTVSMAQVGIIEELLSPGSPQQ